MTNTYRTAEAARLLGIHPSIRTLTGERRYTEADIVAAREAVKHTTRAAA